MQRIEWIDFCRGLFMMMILWFHTEYYYIGNLVIPYSLYVENSLIGFFFISGYLFFPYRNNNLHKKGYLQYFKKTPHTIFMYSSYNIFYKDITSA